MAKLNSIPKTLLFVPGDRPERFAKAASSGADAVILDLEDAVAAASKSAARANVVKHGLAGVSIYVRINAFGTPFFEEDLQALRGCDIDAIVLPKSEGRAEIMTAQELLGRAVPVVALVESARGVGGLSNILSEPSVAFAAFGSLDYALDLGCSHTWEALALARSELVLRSRIMGKPAPVDGVTTEFRDHARVSDDAKRAKELGFGGKLLIHPEQILPTKQAFSPDKKSIEWAKNVLDAIGENGAGSIDGTMIDLPVVERARRILRDAADD